MIHKIQFFFLFLFIAQKELSRATFVCDSAFFIYCSKKKSVVKSSQLLESETLARKNSKWSPGFNEKKSILCVTIVLRKKKGFFRCTNWPVYL